MAVQLTVNISGVLDQVKTAVQSNNKNIARSVANAISTEMFDRIFERGQAADGSQIGEYSKSYLKLRQSKYKRTADKKIVVSLTRKLEKNFGVKETSDGWGIGVNDSKDADKMRWVQEMKGKQIIGLTDAELEQAGTAAVYAINQYLDE